MSIILKVAEAYKSDEERRKLAAQESLKKVLAEIAKSEPILRDVKEWVGDLKKAVKLSLSDDRSGLPEGEIWQARIVEWLNAFDPLRKRIESLSESIDELTLPEAPTVKGRSPDRNRGEASYLLSSKQLPDVAVKPVFHGSDIAYKVQDVQKMEESWLKWLTREKDLAVISKALVAQGKHPNFK